MQTAVLITLVGFEKVVEISDVLKDIWNYLLIFVEYLLLIESNCYQSCVV